MSNRSAKDIMRLLTETSDGVMLGSKKLDPGFTDPGQFGNWVLVERIEAKTADGAFSKDVFVNASPDDRLLIRSCAGGSPTSARIYAMCNDDAGAGNYEAVGLAGSSSGASGYVAQRESVHNIAVDDGGSASETICEILVGRAPDSNWMFQLAYGFRRASNTNYTQTGLFTWLNSAENLDKLTFYEADGGSFNGWIEVYKWQEIKPVELHSYELVAELNGDGSALDMTIPWDGEKDQHMVIIGENIAGTSPVNMQVNGDTASNYRVAFHYGGGTHGSSTAAQNSIIVASEGCATSRFEMCMGLCGAARAGMMSGPQMYMTGDPAKSYMLNYAFGWNNSIDPIQSLRFFTTGAYSGHLKVYRLVPTHLMCSNPGMLNGLWQKTLSASEVEVQPGEIEIGGTICNLRSPRTVSLNNNLKSGETITDDTYYWLYAVKNGTDVQFEFSAEAPSVDRYGNVHADIATQDPKKSWHPVGKQSTHRYIGQVLSVDAAGSVLGFSYCSPARWESAPLYYSTTTYMDTTILHGAGHSPIKPVEAVASQSGESPWSNLPNMHYTNKYWGTYFRRNFTSTSVAACLGHYPFIFTSGWANSGYIKLIINK